MCVCQICRKQRFVDEPSVWTALDAKVCSLCQIILCRKSGNMANLRCSMQNFSLYFAWYDSSSPIWVRNLHHVSGKSEGKMMINQWIGPHEDKPMSFPGALNPQKYQSLDHSKYRWNMLKYPWQFISRWFKKKATELHATAQLPDSQPSQPSTNSAGCELADA